MKTDDASFGEKARPRAQGGRFSVRWAKSYLYSGGWSVKVNRGAMENVEEHEVFWLHVLMGFLIMCQWRTGGDDLSPLIIV